MTGPDYGAESVGTIADRVLARLERMKNGADVRDPSLWGGWIADLSCGDLYHAGEYYEIPLNQCLTADEVFDWILHVIPKRWATPEVLAGLVRLLARLGLCSLRHGSTLTRGWWKSLPGATT